MCASCGCGKPSEQHGDPAHITSDQIDAAANAAGISREQTAKNILSSMQSS